MFPEFEEEYENLPEEEIEGTELGLTPLYDFQKREYVLRDGKVVYCSQKQAAAQWVGFLALTMVGKYRVYDDTEFGTYIENYIGYKDEAFVFSEIKRELQEKAALNRAIKSIEDFEMERAKDKLTVSMTVVMQDGEEEEVTVDV